MQRIILSVFFVLVLVSTAVSQDSSYRASDNTLFILPTGQTVPKGTHQLNSFQLFFIGYNYGVTDRLQLGVFSFFPLNMTLFTQSFSVSAKYKFYSNDRFDVAAMGAVLPANGVTLAMTSGSYSINKTRLHAGLGLAFEFNDPANNSPIISMLGINHGLSERVSLMGEFASLGSSLIDDASGLFTFGARFHFESGNIDFGGMRPSGTGDDFFAFPFLRGTIEF
ncbi:MAG: hypothetical protein JJU41_06430 [Bacteroidetes bacterium]|nr:hypothetical protein [Bacteroidota bacterium]MCH8525127.1 hypothetical protein [Balneolales bacterium]